MSFTSPESAALTVVAQRKDQPSQRTHASLAAGGSLTIGSASSCGLQLESRELSPIHCLLRYEEDGVWVHDWCSKSGTFLDGNAVDSPVPASPGSQIVIGEYSIHVEQHTSEAEAPVAQSPPARPSFAGEASQQAEEPAGRQSWSAVVHPPHRPQAELLADSEDRTAAASPALDLDQALFHADPDVESEMVTLLQAEIDQLQLELAERDAQLAEYVVDTDGDLLGTLDPIESPDVASRLEELLEELGHSDERVADLEELLRVSEEAAQAEQEERRQIESWLSDIERRLDDREQEWRAEQELAEKQLTRVANERSHLQQQLQSSLRSNGGFGSPEEAQRQHQENQALRDQLETAQREIDQLNCALEQKQQDQADTAEVDRLKEELRADRLQLAQERASLTRQKAELTNQVAELDKTSADRGDIDDRVRVFREHLREIHQQEQQHEDEVGLAGRLARLWKRLE